MKLEVSPVISQASPSDQRLLVKTLVVFLTQIYMFWVWGWASPAHLATGALWDFVRRELQPLSAPVWAEPELFIHVQGRHCLGDLCSCSATGTFAAPGHGNSVWNSMWNLEISFHCPSAMALSCPTSLSLWNLHQDGAAPEVFEGGELDGILQEAEST